MRDVHEYMSELTTLSMTTRRVCRRPNGRALITGAHAPHYLHSGSGAINPRGNHHRLVIHGEHDNVSRTGQK